MKRYTSPRLIEIGTISTTTQGIVGGKGDGDNLLAFAMGSVGFNL